MRSPFLVLLLVGCLDARLPEGKVICGPLPERCPDGYRCAADGTCRVIDPAAIKQLKARWEAQTMPTWAAPTATRIALTQQLMDPPSQQMLAEMLGTATNATPDVSVIRDALNRLLSTTWYQAKYMQDPPLQSERDLLKHDIVMDVNCGYPIVANVLSGWRPPNYPSGSLIHYVVIIGYDKDTDEALIADPAGEGAGGMGWSQVPRLYWISFQDLGLWIGGKGYAA